MSEGEREIEGVISKSQAMTSFQHKYSAMQWGRSGGKKEGGIQKDRDWISYVCVARGAASLDKNITIRLSWDGKSFILRA